MNKLIILLAIGFISSSFVPSGDFDEGYFKPGERIVFSHTVKLKASIKRGSYDGTRFVLDIDSSQNHVLSKLRKASGDKQDELMLVLCNGTVAYDGNIMTIELQNTGKKYFMVDMNTGAVTELNNAPRRILLESQDLKGNKAEFYSTDKASEDRLMLTILALPANVKSKEIYAAHHAPKTIAHFKCIRVECENDEQIEFPRGCYMLCSGNSFTLK